MVFRLQLHLLLRYGSKRADFIDLRSIPDVEYVLLLQHLRHLDQRADCQFGDRSGECYIRAGGGIDSPVLSHHRQWPIPYSDSQPERRDNPIQIAVVYLR